MVRRGRACADRKPTLITGSVLAQEGRTNVALGLGGLECDELGHETMSAMCVQQREQDAR